MSSRGSWSEISSDPDIYKKLLIGGICLLTVLPIPVALGAVVEDLESEAMNIKDGKPPGRFVAMDTPSLLLGKGLAPACMFIMALMLFCVPTVVLLMSFAHVYASFTSEHDMSIMSTLITFIAGIVALLAQFAFSIIFPIALAQYARGLHLKAALDPMANIGNMLEMGAQFWAKASGFWFFLIGYIVIYIVGIEQWYVSIPIQVAFAVVGFTSLIVSSRFALSQLQPKA